MHTDPLTGARIPDSTDAPSIAQYFDNAVGDLSDLVGGIFTSNSARDSAFTTWVAQGNTMRDGLVSRVAGMHQIYRSGAWHGVTSIPYSTNAPVDTAVHTASFAIMTLTVPDPVWPAGYKLQCAAQIGLVQLGAGVAVEPHIQVNGADIQPVGFGASNSGGSSVYAVVSVPTAMSGTLTGGSTVTLWLKKTGTAGNGFQADGTSLYHQLSATVIQA